MVVHTYLVLILLAAVQSAVAYCPEACKCTPTRGGQIVTCIGSNLKTIPDGLPTDTEWLNIRDNDLQILNLNDLKTLSRLEGLDVSANNIKTITGWFEHFPNLVRLQLYQNKLTTLSPTTFGKALTWMQYVSLNNNPWNCDCNLKWLVDEMDSEDSPLSSQGVKCETPEEVHGNYTADVDVNKLVCKQMPGLSQDHIMIISALAVVVVILAVAAAIFGTGRPQTGTRGVEDRSRRYTPPPPRRNESVAGMAGASGAEDTGPKSLRSGQPEWLRQDEIDSRDVYQSSRNQGV